MGSPHDRDATPDTTSQDDVSTANARFWSEPSGTILARSLGISSDDRESLRRFDEAYFRYYPYLKAYVDALPLETSRVLEIGLGYGSLGQYLAERSASYRAFDIAGEPVRILRQRLEFNDLRHAEVAQASALDLPLPDGSIDIVVSIGCLHHSGNLAAAIDETSRVLVNGGTALVMIYNRNSFRRLAHVARSRLRALVVGPRRSPGGLEGLRRKYDANLAGEAAPHTEFISAGEARRLFHGFRHVQVDRRNFDDYYYFRGRIRLRRNWFLGWVDRVLGLDLYVVAVK